MDALYLILEALTAWSKAMYFRDVSSSWDGITGTVYITSGEGPERELYRITVERRSTMPE